MQLTKFKYYLLILILINLQSVSYSQSFTTTTTMPLDINTGTNYTDCSNVGTKKLEIPVSGLVNPLNATDNALKLIKLTFNTCSSDPTDSYALRINGYIKSPQGTCLIIFPGATNALSTTYTGETGVGIVSDASCNRSLNTDNLSNSGKNILDGSGNGGYFNAGVDLGTYFLGENPNGIWTIYWWESTLTPACIVDAELQFGIPSLKDETANGDNCSNAIVYTNEPMCVQTNGKTPSLNMPGWIGPDIVNNNNNFASGCVWNGANNNDVWIEITAPNNDEMCISISGLSSSLQSIIVTDPNVDGDNNACTGSNRGGYWDIVLCPRDNNGAIYGGSSGDDKNQTYCWMPNAGQTYYLVVDGNGGNESPFYIYGNMVVICDPPSSDNPVNAGLCINGSTSFSANNPTGTAPLTYQWQVNTGSGFTNITASGSNPTYSGWDANTLNLSNAIAGNNGYQYRCNITNACGNHSTNAATLTVYSNPSGTTVITNENCGARDGAINLTPTGGGGTYPDIDWSNGQATEDISGLSAGTYTVIITDNNTCTGTVTATVGVIGSATASFTRSANQCLTGNTFNFTNTGTTGAGVSFSWVFPSATPSTSNIENPTGVTWASAGTYNVQLTVNDGSCNAVYSEDVIVYSHPSASIVGVEDYCNQSIGSANLSVSGGTTPYSYSWSNSATSEDLSNIPQGNYSVIVTDFNTCTTNANTTIPNIAGPTASISTVGSTCGNCNGSATVTPNGGTPTYNVIWSNGQSSLNIINLCTNDYTVTVTDSKGCTTSVVGTVGQTSTISVNITSSNVTCYKLDNGSATANVTGGVNPLVYQWTASGGYSQNTQAINNLAEGFYTVVVTDNNSCTASSSVQITQPTELVLTQSQQNVRCYNQNNGQANAIATGGTLPYTYTWTGTTQTTSSAINLTAGDYSVVVADNNTCSKSLSYTITQPQELIFSLTSTPETCGDRRDGTITLNGPQGGATPYSYNWSSDSNIGLRSGIYSLVVTDNNSCSKTESILVDLIPKPVITANVINDRCDNSEGSITTTVANNQGVVNYNWVGLGITQPNLTDLGKGNYILEVNDNGCIVRSNIEVVNFGGVMADFYTYPTIVEINKPYCSFYDDSRTRDNGVVSAWLWDFGDRFNSIEKNPIHEYTKVGIYDIQLIVIDQYSCTDTAYKKIEVKNNFTFYMPNAFTPTSDGKNEFYGPKMTFVDEEEYEYRIFDRWGQEIFYTNDINEHWNGYVNNNSTDIVPQGVYVWSIKLKDMQGQEHSYIGQVSLIR